MSRKAKFGVLGSADAAPSAVRDQLELTPLTAGGNNSELEGVLIAGGMPTPEDLAGWFASGLTVAAAEPDAALLSALQAATGVSAAPSPLVVFSPVPGVSGAFKVSTVVDPATMQTSDDGASDAEAPKPLPRSGAPSIVTAAIPEDFFSSTRAEAPILRGANVDDFIPRDAGGQAAKGVAAGHEKIMLVINESIGQSIACDKRMNSLPGRVQKYAGTYTADFHCYWVDGPNERNPHFVVMLKQSCKFNPAADGPSDKKTMAWEGWTKGWFLPTAWFEPITFQVQGARNATLLDWSPKGDSERDLQSYDLSHQLYLRAGDLNGGRSAAISYTAGSRGTNNFKSWRCKDRVNQPTLAPSWQFHMDCVFDPTIHKLHEFGNWYTGVYDPDDVHHVRDFCEQTRKELEVGAVSAWVIQCDSTMDDGAPKPAPVSLRMIGGLKTTLASIHCRNGCTNARNHLSWADRWWHFDKTYQLDQLVQL